MGLYVYETTWCDCEHCEGHYENTGRVNLAKQPKMTPFGKLITDTWGPILNESLRASVLIRRMAGND
jgi:hypothetical protein